MIKAIMHKRHSNSGGVARNVNKTAETATFAVKYTSKFTSLMLNAMTIEVVNQLLTQACEM